MNPRPAGILFDLDGTLLDTLSSIATAMNDALDALSLPTHPHEAYRQFVGDGVRELASRSLGALQQGYVEKVVALYLERYAEIQFDAPPYPGIPETLSALSSMGIPYAVLTNKPDAAAKEIVAAQLPNARFAEVRGEREGVARKPDPAAAFELALKMRAAPAACWFVGDSSIDIQTAHRASMTSIAVLWGFRDREEFVAHGASRIIKHPRELFT